MKLRYAIPLGLLIVGCSGNDDAKEATANTCATRGASYILSCLQQSGDCGPIPDQVINVAEDGTFGGKQTCDSSEQDGCTGRGTNCRQTSEGCSTKSTFSTTFTEDGSSATSTISISSSCDDGSYCYSTYNCTAERM